MADNNRKLLKKLRALRKEVNWKVKRERHLFLLKFYNWIRDWNVIYGQRHDLRAIFRPEEIDWILTQSSNISYEHSSSWTRAIKIIGFVIETGYKDEPEFDKDGKPSSHRTTAVHHLAKHGYAARETRLIHRLFVIYDRFDVNYSDDSNFTHFHAACEYGDEAVVKKFLEFGQDPNCVWRKTGDSPLLLAMFNEHKAVAELLLRGGADPNLANENGITPLHVLCKKFLRHDDFINLFFEISDEKHQTVLVNAQDSAGDTPLHLALGYNADFVDWITRYVAWYDDSFYDARNSRGDTPNRSWLSGYNRNLVELLLTRGSDPNLVNKEKSTPLHIICKRLPFREDNLAEFFFMINDELNQAVRVNVRDAWDRTPLDLAIANFSTKSVHAILSRGADLSTFALPNHTYFGKRFEFPGNVHVHSYKLELASGALTIVKLLEEKGYEFDHSDALTIMRLFPYYGLFDESAEICWDDEEEGLMEEIMIKPDLSLLDLFELRLQEIGKRLAYSDYFELSRSKKLDRLRVKLKEFCTLLLCEAVSRRFFRRWALDFFLELIHYRLPILCCDIIIESLTNQDLYNICLATEG